MSYNGIAIGLSDPSIEVAQSVYQPVLPTLKAVQPAYWRLLLPWSLTATTLRPGPYQGGGRQVVTATATGSGVVGDPHTHSLMTVQALTFGTGQVAGIAPSAQGRDWHYVDNVINDIRLLTGADVVLVVGQDRPSGGTNAEFKAFCAESVQRYGPGGAGIRTDGQYAANAGWGVRLWEMWNEQNNGAFWHAAVSASDYTSLLQAGYQGVKSVLPGTPAPGTAPTGTQSLVIFGGMQHIPFEGSQFFTPYVTLDEARFLQQCYTAAFAMGTTLGTMFDVMATHVYPGQDPTNPSPAAAPNNIISSQNIPSTATTGRPQITAFAAGAGKVNINPQRSGALLTAALATGTGVINPYESPGPVPDILMDNFRQVLGIYAQMQANGDGAKKIWITEIGYSVYDAGITAQLQQTYIKGCLDVLATIPAVTAVFLYNGLDTTNSTTTSDTAGFGLLDYNKNPRPLYNWLLTLPTLTGGGMQSISAAATGTGGLGGQGTLSVSAARSGAGIVVNGGGVIFVVTTGSGFVAPTHSGSQTITAAAVGVGVVGTVGSTTDFTAHGSLIISAARRGTGKVGVNLQKNGDLIVTALATGAGTVPHIGATVIAAGASGSGSVFSAGLEVGVVGEVTGGAPVVVTATIAGAGMLISPQGGALTDTVVITGAGKVGKVGAAAASVAATATGAASSSAVGAGAPSIAATAVGAGVVATFTGGSLTVTATATGSPSGNGSSTVTAAITGAGVVNKIGTGASSIADSISGAGLVSAVGAGASSITAAAVGAGFVAVFGTGTLTVTESSFGSTGFVGNGARPVSATATGSGFVAESTSAAATDTVVITGTGVVGTRTGGTLPVTATATGAGLITESTGAAATDTVVITGAGFVGIFTSAAPTITDTGVGAGVVNAFLGGSSSITATATGSGAVGDRTGGATTDTVVITGAGAVGKVTTGAALSVTSTATGSGTVGTVGAGSLTVTESSFGISAAAFVSRDPATGYLMLSGKRVRYAGANCANDIGTVSSSNGNGYSATVNTSHYITPHTQIDALITSARQMNMNVLKAAWAVLSVGSPLAIQPTIGVFNSAAMDPIDYALQQCALYGIKLVLPFCEEPAGTKQWYVTNTTNGALNDFYTAPTTVAAYKLHISYVLNHVNTYTGIALKNDPTVLCWQTGNEFLAPAPLTWTDYATWGDDIGHHIKVVEGAGQLVMDGHYGIDSADPVVLQQTYVDLYDDHAYNSTRTAAWMATNEGNYAHSYGKAFSVGEFTWTDDTGVNGGHAAVGWLLDDQLTGYETLTSIDIDTFWDLLAPATSWGDGFTLHSPADATLNSPTLAQAQQRHDMLADHALRMPGMVPKVFVSDDFTGTNGTVQGSHVGATGAVWTQQGGWTGVGTIQNNRLYAGSEAHYYASGVPASTDYSVSADIYCASMVASAFAGVQVRSYTNEDFCYQVYVWADTGTAATIYLDYGKPGTNTNLNSQAITVPTVGSTHNLRLSVAGSVLSVYWDGALLYTATASNLPAAGRVGTLQGGGSSTTGFHIDNIVGSDPVGGNPVITATATGSGTVGKVSAGSLGVTATATGTPAFGYFVLDTFTDAITGNPLASHVGETGATWTVLGGFPGEPDLASGRLYAGNLEGHYNASGVPPSADYTVSADIKAVSLLGYMGVLARSGTSDVYYAAYIYQDNTVYLDRGQSGTDANLGFFAVPTITVGTTHNLALTVIGSRLTVFWDGTPIISVTDSTYSSAGSVGIIEGGSSSPWTTVGFQMDTFTASPALTGAGSSVIAATATGTGSSGASGTEGTTAVITGSGAVGIVGDGSLGVAVSAAGSGPLPAAPVTRHHMVRVYTRHRLR